MREVQAGQIARHLRRAIRHPEGVLQIFQYVQKFFHPNSLIYPGRKNPVGRADHKGHPTGLMKGVIAVHPGAIQTVAIWSAALWMHRSGMVTAHALT